MYERREAQPRKFDTGSIPALAFVYVIMTRGQISHKLWRDTQFGMPLSSPTYCDSL